MAVNEAATHLVDRLATLPDTHEELLEAVAEWLFDDEAPPTAENYKELKRICDHLKTLKF